MNAFDYDIRRIETTQGQMPMGNECTWNASHYLRHAIRFDFQMVDHAALDDLLLKVDIPVENNRFCHDIEIVGLSSWIYPGRYIQVRHRSSSSVRRQDGS